MLQEHKYPLVTIRELWELSGRRIGIVTLRRWAKEGRIRSIPVGRKRLVPSNELERLAELAEAEAR